MYVRDSSPKSTSTASEGGLHYSTTWNSNTRPPSIAVIEAIAAIKGIDPMDMDSTLYDYIDPDALNQLFLSNDLGDIEVDFTIDQYTLTVRRDGGIEIREMRA